MLSPCASRSARPRRDSARDEGSAGAAHRCGNRRGLVGGLNRAAFHAKRAPLLVQSAAIALARVPTVTEPQELLAPVQEYLAAPRCCVLSSLTKSGSPHQAVVHYVPEADAVWVNGDADRVWVRNLQRDPRASMVIHDSADDLHWVGISAYIGHPSTCCRDSSAGRAVHL